MVKVSGIKMETIFPQMQINENIAAAYEESILRSFYRSQIYNFKLHVCKEVFMTIPEVIYTKKDFYLLHAINEKINIFVSSGLINFWSFENIDKLKLREVEKTYPEVLLLDQFKGCFGILMAGVVMSVIAFFCEIYL